jgi:hypothetical protein
MAARRSARLGAIAVEVSADLAPMKRDFSEGKTVAAQAGREMGAAVASGFKQTMQAVARSTMRVAGANTLDPEMAELTRQLQGASANARMKGLNVQDARMQILMGDHYDVRNNPFNAGRLMGGFGPRATAPGFMDTYGGYAAGAVIGLGARGTYGAAADAFNGMVIDRRAAYEVGQLRQQAGRLSAAGLDSSAVGASIEATKAAALVQKLDESRVPLSKFIADLTGGSDAIRRHAASASAAADSIRRQIGEIRAINVTLAGGPKFGQSQNPLAGVAAENQAALDSLADEEAEELRKSPGNSAVMLKFAERRAKLQSANKERMRFAGNVRDASMRAMDMTAAGTEFGIAATRAEMEGNSMAALLAGREQQRLEIEGRREVTLAQADPETRRRLEMQYEKEDVAFGLQTQFQARSMAISARPGMSMGGMDAMAVGGVNATAQQNINNVPRLLELILQALTAPKHVNGN